MVAKAMTMMMKQTRSAVAAYCYCCRPYLPVILMLFVVVVVALIIVVVLPLRPVRSSALVRVLALSARLAVAVTTAPVVEPSHVRAHAAELVAARAKQPRLLMKMMTWMTMTMRGCLRMSWILVVRQAEMMTMTK